MAELPPALLATCKDNQGPMLVTVGWIFLSISITTVLLRLYVRSRLLNGLNADDWTILASLIAGTTAIISLTIFTHYGVGQHIYCLPPASVPQAIHWSITAQIFNILGLGLLKTSICLTVLRILHNSTSRTLTHLLHAFLALTLLSHTAQILLFVFQCRPMNAIWDPTARLHASCFSSHITYLAGYIGFGIDALTDLVCAAIPVFIIRRLQMSSRTKAGLSALMALGSLTAACAVAKAVELRGVFAQDYTFALVRPAVCTILEHTVGMAVASLPGLRPLFVGVVERGRWRGYGSWGRRERSRRAKGGSGMVAVTGKGVGGGWCECESGSGSLGTVDVETVADDGGGGSGGGGVRFSGGGFGNGNGNGNGRRGDIVRTVSWRLSEHHSEIEKGEGEG